MTAAVLARLKQEWALPVAIGTTLAFLAFGDRWLADLTRHAWFALMFGWLFVAILVAAFAVVRHAEALAERVGEPFGTLVLTLAMSGMEMMMISAVMFAGQGGASLARDTMLAIVMIVLNGLVGVCLLAGGLRYHTQSYNLYSANSFLAVILPLSVLGLVLPGLTTTTPGPTLSGPQSVFLMFISIALYVVFLGIQTVRHRDYFISPAPAVETSAPLPAADELSAQEAPEGAAEAATPSVAAHHATGSTGFHAGMLLAYAIPIVLLAKQIARPIDYGIGGLKAPAAVGGLIVAVLILSPESLAAVRAALANQLQRSINVALGTALTTISLTIPAVLTIGFLTDQSIVLGLDAVDTVLLLLTLVVSMLTFALARTNVLNGAVHIVLFLAYLLLLFEQ